MRNNYKTKITKLLVLTIFSFTFCNIYNSSALDYQSSTNIGFTFNPTLSISLSSADLVIPNLAPGSTLDSNSINVSVATNALYGYTLSATVGDSNHDNSNLTHSNNTNVFSSIAIDAGLSSLDEDEDTNIWGYSYKDNTVETPAWSNYNGLSSSNSATLLDTNTNNIETGIDSIDFKIAAKASSTQPSGTYTGTINFTAVSNVAPMSLLDSFIASGAKQLNGYYKMQDMTHDICEAVDIEESELQLIDIRDNKIYWVAKLKDGNCWMTQNLDLDLDSNRTYTHWDTDLGWSDPNNLDTNASWQPDNSTIDFSIGSIITGWQDSGTEPYSANPGDVYYYTSNSDADDIKYNSLQECINAGHNDCTHYHAGNYYNWSVAAASNDTNGISNSAPDSVCPKGWTLSGTQRNVTGLLGSYGINTMYSYNYEAFRKIRTAPLYFNKSGSVEKKQHRTDSTRYWYGYLFSSNSNMARVYSLTNTSGFTGGGNRFTGGSIRCLVR